MTRDENDDIIKLHYELQNTPKHDIGADVVFFLRSKRLTGRLAVVIVSVKPFAKIGAATSAITVTTNSAMNCKEYTSLLAEV